MIRYAEIKDIEQGVKLLNENIVKFDFAKNNKNNNTEYYNVLLQNLIKDKTVIVSENNSNIDGVLICARVPNILNPHNMQLQILVTWVKKNKRGSSIFYRMNKFLENEFKNFDKIYYDIHGETKLNYEKIGYRPLTTGYIKERN